MRLLATDELTERDYLQAKDDELPGLYEKYTCKHLRGISKMVKNLSKSALYLGV